MKHPVVLIASLLTFAAFAQGPLPPVEGEVRKVDKEAGKITLKHGEIKNLDMPGMTMAFQVKDPAMLDAVKVGDQVSFTVDKIQGAYTVFSIEPRK
jgi:Cu(I)/Ag(I) efflux system protein CusF